MTDEQLANLRRLAEQATTAPWRVATEDDVGDNWLVGFGRSTADNQTYFVTTDHVHASELYGDARTDAEFIAAARTAVPELLDAIAAMTARAEAAEQAALVKGNEWAQAVKTSTALRERWQAAEAKLAAIPTESLTYCWYAEDSEREDDDWEHHANIVGNWLAQLRKEAQP